MVDDHDRQLLAFAAVHPFVLADHALEFLGVDRRTVEHRLATLEQARLLRSERLRAGWPALIRITASGLATIDSRLPVPTLPPAGLRKQIGLVWLWLAARRGALGECDRVLSTREQRGLDHAAKNTVGSERPTLFGSGDRTYGLAELRYPDLMLVAGADRVAVHLQLASPRPGDLDTLLQAYGSEPLIGAALFLVENRVIGEAVETRAQTLGLARLVHVQLAVVGPADRALPAA
jgi:hypothetical protein